MAKIEKTVNGGFNRITVDLWMTDAELEVFEKFRKRSEDHIRRVNNSKEVYTLDHAAIYIICEVLAGRGGFIDVESYAFK